MTPSIAGRVITALCTLTLLGPGVGQAAAACQTVAGKILEVQVPSSDPFGRVAGPVTGTLNGGATAILTSLIPGPSDTLTATTEDTFVLNGGDMLVTTGNAVFSPVPGQPGTFADALTLTVNGAASSGRFAGATGTITVTGVGFNLGAGPGVTFFELRYRGEVCSA